MTNRIAIALALLIAAGFVVDALWLHGDAPLVLAKLLDRFIEYLSFWR